MSHRADLAHIAAKLVDLALVKLTPETSFELVELQICLVLESFEVHGHFDRSC